MANKLRSANIKRTTTETDISGTLVIDGKGATGIETGIGFLDHMLTLFGFHGLFDLTVKAKGDLKVDIHHTNEDVAICLGKAFKSALGDCAGIRRYGSKEVPMDTAARRPAASVSGDTSTTFTPKSSPMPTISGRGANRAIVVDTTPSAWRTPAKVASRCGVGWPSTRMITSARPPSRGGAVVGPAGGWRTTASTVVSASHPSTSTSRAGNDSHSGTPPRVAAARQTRYARPAVMAAALHWSRRFCITVPSGERCPEAA